jgi:hypothetical protein
MNRTLQTFIEDDSPPSRVLQTLAITGYAAEFQLRDVAEALAKKDQVFLAGATERNAKLARLRVEIEEQVGLEMTKPMVGARARNKLVLTSKLATAFEMIGSETVKVAELCSKVIRLSKPSRVTEIKKLIEHAVFAADRAACGFVYDELPWAKTGAEQGRAALVLQERINRDLALLLTTDEDSARIKLLEELVAQIGNIIKHVEEMTKEIIVFLESSDI